MSCRLIYFAVSNCEQTSLSGNSNFLRLKQRSEELTRPSPVFRFPSSGAVNGSDCATLL